jgi:hypothetical protein
MSGARHRRKGDRVERELIQRHKEIGVHAERHPLSGATRFRGSGHDIDLYPFGRDEAPFVAESKARKSGNGFVQLERWLGEYDPLFLRRNNAPADGAVALADVGIPARAGAVMKLNSCSTGKPGRDGNPAYTERNMTCLI